MRKSVVFSQIYIYFYLNKTGRFVIIMFDIKKYPIPTFEVFVRYLTTSLSVVVIRRGISKDNILSIVEIVSLLLWFYYLQK